MYNYNYSEDYIMHYGVKGMKWGVRRNRGISGTIRDMQRSSANKSLSKIDAKRKHVDSELKELRGYDRNPSGFGKSKVSTAIRRNQIKSLEKTRSELNAKAKSNKDALKELDSIEKHKQAKKEAANTPEAKAARKAKVAKAAKIGAAVAGTALAAYGAKKVHDMIRDKNRDIRVGKELAEANFLLRSNSLSESNYGKGLTNAQIKYKNDQFNKLSKQMLDNAKASGNRQADRDSFRTAAKNVYDDYRKNRKR